jgi:hypothetical protein
LVKCKVLARLRVDAAQPRYAICGEIWIQEVANHCARVGDADDPKLSCIKSAD